MEEASLPLVEKAGEVRELGVASISVEPVISSNETTIDPPLARAVPGARLLSRSHFLIVEEFHLRAEVTRVRQGSDLFLTVFSVLPGNIFAISHHLSSESQRGAGLGVGVGGS